jgi:chitinase domain-containing protein 1
LIRQVTPWNRRGYEVAVQFRGKFSHLAPVWFQIERTGPETYAVRGDQDVDRAWLANVTRPTDDGRRARVLPRVIVENLGRDHFFALLQDKIEQRAFAAALAKICTTYAFDGVTLELWSRVQVTPDLRAPMASMLGNLGKRLHKKGLLFALVVPPHKESFGPSELRALAPDVDLFSMNTYDYSQPSTAGPNSPIEWAKACITALKADAATAPKLVMGLNWYGNIYGPAGGQALLGHQYLDILRAQHHAISTTWNAHAQEHVMRFVINGVQSSIYYPTDRSLQARVDLARELGVGIGIWEIGQGLDHFYDLI